MNSIAITIFTKRHTQSVFSSPRALSRWPFACGFFDIQEWTVVYFEDKALVSFDGTYDEFVSSSDRDDTDIQTHHEIQRLELALTQLMSADTSTPKEHERLMNQIRDVQAQLNGIRKG